MVVLLLLFLIVCANCKNKDFCHGPNYFLNDYDLLWQILEEEYVFFPYIEEKGIAINELRERYRERISKEACDITSFENILSSMFFEMGNIGHLSVLDSYGYEAYRELYYDEYGKLLDTKRVKTTYEEKLQDNHNQYYSNQPSNISFQYDEEINAAVIQIKSFDNRHISRDHDKIIEYLKFASDKSVDNLVFDLTGNSGGSDYFWINNIVSVLGGDYEWQDMVYVKNTSYAREYYFSNYSFKPVSDLSGSKVPSFVKKLGLTHYAIFNHHISGEIGKYKDISNAKRWVLIDQNVYSSAETFVNFCKKTGWAQTVGTKTRGDGMGFEAILTALPNSGLLVRFKILCPLNASGDLDVIVGSAPDYVSTPKETPYDTLRKIVLSIRN